MPSSSEDRAERAAQIQRIAKRASALMWWDIGWPMAPLYFVNRFYSIGVARPVRWTRRPQPHTDGVGR